MLLYFLVSTVPTVAECTVSSAVLPEPPFWLEPEPEKEATLAPAPASASTYANILRKEIKQNVE